MFDSLWTQVIWVTGFFCSFYSLTSLPFRIRFSATWFRVIHTVSTREIKYYESFEFSLKRLYWTRWSRPNGLYWPTLPTLKPDSPRFTRVTISSLLFPMDDFDYDVSSSTSDGGKMFRKFLIKKRTYQTKKVFSSIYIAKRPFLNMICRNFTSISDDYNDDEDELPTWAILLIIFGTMAVCFLVSFPLWKRDHGPISVVPSRSRAVQWVWTLF